MTTFSWMHAAMVSRLHALSHHARSSERGEGVISAAIVVLIMALIGGAMWIAFNRIWTDTETKTEQHVSSITT